MIFKDFLNRKSQEHPRRPVVLIFLFCLLYAFCHCEKSTLSYNKDEDEFGNKTLAPNTTPEAWTRITTAGEAGKGDSAELTTTVLAPDTTPEAWTRITTTEEAATGKGRGAELTTVFAPDTTPEAWTGITTTGEAGKGDSWIIKSWKI